MARGAHVFTPVFLVRPNFTVIIEILKGSKKKYELDKESGLIRLDRIYFTFTRYPMNYGFVPRTLTDDQDPLDVLVLCSEALDPLTEVDGYPIGVVKMIDNDHVDEKIIAIPFRDPTYNSFHDLSDLPQHTVSEVSHFFDVYKAPEHSKTSVTETKGREEAVRIVARAIQRYQEVFADEEQTTPPGQMR